MTDAIILAGRSNDGAFREVSPAPLEALVEIAGRPMVSYVVEALRGARGVGRVVVVGPCRHLQGQVEGAEVAESGATLAENIERGFRALQPTGPVLVASSDIPFLTPAVVEDLLASCAERPAAICYPVVERSVCLARYPDARRTFVTLREGAFTGGNLFLVDPAFLPQLLDLVGRFYAARKSPLRLASLLGWRTVARFLLKRSSIEELEGVCRRLAGAEGRAVICGHPEVGMDVDKPEDLALARTLLGGGGCGRAC